MVGFWDKLYQSNSLTAKCLSLLRYYGVFRRTYSLLQKSQWWSREELEAYQVQQLKRLVHHAYENVPYYRRVFDERGLKPEDIQSLSDIQKLPFLTKDIIRDNIEDLKARNYPEDAFEYVTTGGSTGIPLGFYYEKGVSRAKEWAFMKTQWDRVGYHFYDKCVILRGNVVHSSKEGKYWEKTFFGRWLVLSSYHLTPENLPKYVAEIQTFKPSYIQAYPSVIMVLANYMKSENLKPIPSLRAILCGSEKLYPWQRELLEDVFQCRVFSWYGHSEMAVLAGECEKCSDYHIFPEYGITELIDKDGQPIVDEKTLGEVVSTSLTNYVCPLIRYRTQDLALFSKKTCMCGRNYPIFQNVEGRVQDIIITKDNRPITLTALVFAQHFGAFSRVKEMQLIQEELGKIIIKIVRDSHFSNCDEQEIISKMLKSVGNNLEISFEYVDTIPRTASGKYRFLIQKLPLTQQWNGGL